ncbi:RHS repeat-associated core domain-containing protein [Paraburkholderia humisilvae]|uniref:RHS repeat-associated core domain-containing protein n=1 Tax=Paraburkholderia humisilvae TaxID=627669 RepID=A0A6J5EH22_9BURK|nr:RHS repeat-associated core domain-containing protein [Paraburkholderia humisilvae]CAB3764576.1 hypothetical protein LMG29542_04929 [Paraburkholderia humisilvae]
MSFKLGLYYYKARMYSPGLGRFLQTDPVGYQDDLNWYAYAKNNPINLTDPGGMIASASGNFANTSSPAAANVAAQSSTGDAKLGAPTFSMPKSEVGDKPAIQLAGADGMPGNNYTQNKQTRAIAVQLGLTKDQSQQLHREIGGQGMGYHEALERAKDMFNKW